MEPIVVIPARYESSRFPGKPLAEVAGCSLIARVWYRCVPVVGEERVFVATDDSRIAEHCRQRDMRYVMTPTDCPTGTDRLAAAAQELEADYYVNVQGDEPLVEPSDIQTVIDAATRDPHSVLNATCAIDQSEDYENRNVPKVVMRPDGRLLYMSRAPIPANKEDTLVEADKQVCIYGFPPRALYDYASTSGKTALESIEDVEILRFLELGYEVRMVRVSGSSIAVDVPSDVERVEGVLKEHRRE